MKSDQTSYKRATLVSLIGLSVQGMLALAMLLYSLIGNDPLAQTGALYLLLGLPVWFALALVFHQHQLERIEAAEEELLRAGSAAQVSVFQEAGAELRVAARKLAWMHRALLPTISLLVGLALIVLGWMRYRVGVSLMNPDVFLPTAHTGWAMTIGLLTAAIGFIFARFVAGMAQADVWSNLRAGATWAVGASVVGLLIAAAQGLSFAASDALLIRTPMILAIMMMALGAEIFLNFLLAVYRPRKPGESPRPAFDSRVLGFIAAPDRIAESISEAVNYQFGLDVSSSWFYKLLSRSFFFLLMVGGASTWLLTTIAVVEPEEKAAFLRSGRLVRVADSSVSLKLPWPFEHVEQYPAQRLTILQLAAPPHVSDDGAPILWTESHGFDERMLLVRSSNDRAGSGVTGSGLEYALVAAEIPLEYVVEDLDAFLWLAADSEDPNDRDANRRELLKAVASRVTFEYLSTRTIDDILGQERSAINAELLRRIESKFASMNVDPKTGTARGAGVRVVFVGIVGAHPPFERQVGASYEDVVNSEQRRLADFENAQANAIKKLAAVAGDVDLAKQIVRELDTLERLTEADAPEADVTTQRQRVEELIDAAGGEAAGMLLRARADRWTRHMEFRGRASRQEGRLAMYRAAPEVYLASMYLNALRDAVKTSRLFITTFHAPNVSINFEQIESTLDNILNETRAEEE